MHTDIKIPTLPESGQDAKITNIFVQEGQVITAGDILFDVETEKVVLEIEASNNGIIDNIYILNGQSVSSEQLAMRLLVNESPAHPEQSTSAKTTDITAKVNEKQTKDKQESRLQSQKDKDSATSNSGIVPMTLQYAAFQLEEKTI